MKVLLIGGTGCISGDIAALAAQKSGVELYLLNRGNRPQFIPPVRVASRRTSPNPTRSAGEFRG